MKLPKWLKKQPQLQLQQQTVDEGEGETTDLDSLSSYLDAKLNYTPFGFRKGDYALVHFTGESIAVRRVWNRFSSDELFKLIPALEHTQDEFGVDPFPPADDTDPLIDIEYRRRGN